MGLLHKYVTNDIGAHAEGFLTGGLQVIVHVLVFPAVAEVALPGEEAHQTSFPDEFCWKF